MSASPVKSISRLQLIARLGQEWRELRARYPEDDPERRGWRTLAVGIAIAALAEEEYRVGDWRDLMPKRKRKTP